MPSRRAERISSSSTLDEASAMNRSLVSFRPCLCSLQTILARASVVCREETSRLHRSLARSTDYYFVVAAVPVFARLGTHHVCFPELCPWIDLHAALFVTLPVTLGRANLPAEAWSPPDAQKPATKRPISRPAQPLGSMCFP
jgi:hypothetical protein